MSSAAAFDAAHISRMTVASIGGRHSLELGRRDTGPNSGQSVSAGMDAPSFHGTGRDSRANSQPALQRKVEVQSGEPEEIGKQ
jgi:hypothetical protein